ncbi:hypothetical protein [Aestuariirhabdus sp. LZHN29]|uniref:hypothetical protein n=1 Tax=Aestuariirhabdus sp. LZHN29 TaxID=3417462 RepID=UPI003CE84F34
MTTFLITVLLATLILLGFYALFYLSQRKRRRLGRDDVLQLISARVSGEGGIQWVSFLSLPIYYDVFLESVRIDCNRIESDENLVGQGQPVQLSADACDRYRELIQRVQHHFELTC